MWLWMLKGTLAAELNQEPCAHPTSTSPHRSHKVKLLLFHNPEQSAANPPLISQTPPPTSTVCAPQVPQQVIGLLQMHTLFQSVSSRGLLMTRSLPQDCEPLTPSHSLANQDKQGDWAPYLRAYDCIIIHEAFTAPKRKHRLLAVAEPRAHGTLQMERPDRGEYLRQFVSAVSKRLRSFISDV